MRSVHGFRRQRPPTTADLWDDVPVELRRRRRRRETRHGRHRRLRPTNPDPAFRLGQGGPGSLSDKFECPGS